MVETLTTTDAAAVGARLIYPSTSRRIAGRSALRRPDPPASWGGVRSERGGARRPASWAPARTRVPPRAVAVVERPALTAACLLVEQATRSTRSGASAPEYDYGLEDVDLCLNLRAAGGRLVYDGRAALWHHESATRVADPALRRSPGGPEPRGVPRRLGATHLPRGAARRPRWWRPVLERPVPRGDHRRRRRVRRRGSRGCELGALLAALGWRVSLPVPDADGALALDAVGRGDHRRRQRVSTSGSCRRASSRSHGSTTTRALAGAALVRRLRHRPRRRPDDDRDLVRAGSSKVATAVPAMRRTRPAAIRDALATWAAATRYGLRDRGPDVGCRRALGRLPLRAGAAALARAGRPPDAAPLPARLGRRSPTRATTSPSTCSGSRRPRPGAARSTSCGRSAIPTWPRPAIYERYDHVFVASDRVRRPDGRPGRRAGHLAPPGDRSGALPAGAGRPAPRAPVRGQLAQGPPADRGRPGGHDPRPRDLRRQLDDRTSSTRASSRARASRTPSSRATTAPPRSCSTTTGTTCSPRASSRTGCTTRSPAGRSSSPTTVDGIEAEFDDAVATYADRAELDGLIERYLADPDERRRRGARGRAAVLARHTFDERTRVVREVADRLLPVARSR